MSNVMSLKTIKNKPNRSAFDLSMRKCFTAKVGELLPVFFKECLPGDKFKLGLNSFTRTQPVNSAAYTRIKEYYDYFFVPYRLLWRYFDQFVTDTQESNPQFALSLTQSSSSVAQRTPYFLTNDVVTYLNTSGTLKLLNEFGFYRNMLSYKLLKYLGYGLFSTPSTSDPSSIIVGGSTNIQLNAFPLLAYQKICQDYFRNSQWEKANPTTYNVDYLNSVSTKIDLSPLSAVANRNNRNLFDLNYCTWNKDLFTGLLPSPQYGDTAYIQTGLNQNVSFDNGDVHGDFAAAGITFDVESNSNHTGSVPANTMLKGNGSLDGASSSNFAGTFRLTNDEFSSFSVLALRQAQALQKWKEVSLSGKQDYKDQIEKHFGVTVPDVRSNLCTWIAGSVGVLDIGEVVNTNLQGINSTKGVEASIAGRGVGSLSGRDEFTSSEHGILMCLYHAVPLMDYTDDVTDLFMFKGSKFDYAIPEFDSVGMQSVPGLALNIAFADKTDKPSDVTGQANLSSDLFNSLGYAPRYVEYKTSVDIVTGAFNGSLAYWAAPMSSLYFNRLANAIKNGKKLTPAFFKCNPSILDSIFAFAADASLDSDNFLVSCFNDIKAVRNLDYNGLPY